MRMMNEPTNVNTDDSEELFEKDLMTGFNDEFADANDLQLEGIELPEDDPQLNDFLLSENDQQLNDMLLSENDPELRDIILSEDNLEARDMMNSFND
ncbi:hypothetical protein [Clostridium sp. ZS2-4]|uniref:hypothetical protein n=1 Tax=Clostridium sp. ZS2-4 TaxID=2987703 RepID=UPI00227B74A0|nr:hypothetical protein [Clostridium sp. ZS2-4]MCY6355410.1 hypothetical protein [Clostridium sp. ZS2-4]